MRNCFSVNPDPGLVLNLKFNLPVYLSGLWEQTRCTATATCSGCQTGWSRATRSLASPAAPARETWLTNCSSPRPQRSSPAKVRNSHIHADTQNLWLKIHTLFQVSFFVIKFSLFFFFWVGHDIDKQCITVTILQLYYTDPRVKEQY